MGKLIDGDRLCNDLVKRWSIADKKKEDLIRVVMADVVTPIVVSQPTVDAVPVVHGRWIQVSQDRANCNRCNCESGKMIKQGERYFPKFCPECGADMRKDGEAHGTK